MKNNDFQICKSEGAHNTDSGTCRKVTSTVMCSALLASVMQKVMDAQGVGQPHASDLCHNVAKQVSIGLQCTCRPMHVQRNLMVLGTRDFALFFSYATPSQIRLFDLGKINTVHGERN